MDRITQAFRDNVREHIEDKNLDPIKQYLRSLSPAEIIQGLKEIDHRDLPVVFRLLPKDLATDVFDLMEVGDQSELVESFSSEEAVQLLGALDPDDRVHLLDELPATGAKRLLEQLPKEQREITTRLMGCEDDTVGRIMMPIYVDVKKQMTVSDAIERIRRRNNGGDLTVNAVYVTDETRRLEGVVPAGALLEAFEETLEAVVATAIFIPVIMDMGGNVGTHSSAIFTRAVVLAQININRFVRYWLREVVNGLRSGSKLVAQRTQISLLSKN